MKKKMKIILATIAAFLTAASCLQIPLAVVSDRNLTIETVSTAGLNEFDVIYGFRQGLSPNERYRVAKRINNDRSAFVDDAGVIVQNTYTIVVEQSGYRKTSMYTAPSPVRYRGGSAWKITSSTSSLPEMYVYGSGNLLVIDVILAGAHPHVLFQCVSDARLTNCKGLDNSIFGYFDRTYGLFYVKEGFLPSYVIPSLYNYVMLYKP